MRAEEIINLVNHIRNTFQDKDLTNPFRICEAFNIPIRKISLNPKLFPAFTTNISGNPVISLNEKHCFKTQFI